MLRRHFITGGEKPDFIITYYAPEHIPFCNGYKDEIDSLMLNDNSELETKIQFKCILDTFDDGVGQYGIKLLNDNNGLWCSAWTTKFNPLNDFSSLGFYHEISSGITYNNTNDITCIILPKEIKHLNGTLMAYPNHYNYSVENIILPEYLETLNNKVLYSLQAIKNIIIPDTVTFMSDHTLQIDCDSDNVGSADTGNMSLEEIILKPFTPPDSDTNNPIGVYDTSRYINPNLKIRVYADCLDTYKNDSVWGQYSDLYDTINNTIVYYDMDGRQLFEQLNDFTNVSSNSKLNTAISIHFPNSVTSIGNGAFSNCGALTSVTIPNSVTHIGDYAFYYCESLSSIVIPDGVTSIGEWTFAYSGLTSVTIPTSVESIGEYTFYACTSLRSITFQGTRAQWNSITLGGNWKGGVPAKVVHCTDGDIEL